MFGVRYDPEAEDISTIAWNGKRKREEDLDSSDIGSDNLGEQNDTKELSKGKENHDIDHEDSTNRIDTTEEVGFSNGVEEIRMWKWKITLTPCTHLSINLF